MQNEPMATSGALKAYIAFSTDVDIQALTSIEPGWFGGKSQGNYVPLKLNPDLAVKAALESSFNFMRTAKAATECTVWYVLSLTLSPEELAQAWSTGMIHWSVDMAAIEWWGNLGQQGIGKLECVVTELAPIGLGSWSHMTCERKLWLPSAPSGTCGSCGPQRAPVWTSTAEFEYADYCTTCWHQFIKAKFADHGTVAEPEQSDPQEAEDWDMAAPIWAQ